MLEVIIVPVCFVVFVLYLTCSLYREQRHYYKLHHPNEKDMNDDNYYSDVDETNTEQTEEVEENKDE